MPKKKEKKQLKSIAGLRPADIHDSLSITLLWSKMIGEVFDKFIKLDKTELDKFAFALIDRLRVDHTLTNVVEENGRVVGFIHGYIQARPYGKPDRIAFCECLFIEKEHRNKGLKALLVESFISWAQERELPIEFMTKYDPELVKVWKRYGNFAPYSMIFRR